MLEIFYFGLALASLGFFIVQFRRAFFSGKEQISENWFGPLDVSLAVLISVLLGTLIMEIFAAPERTFSEKDVVNGVFSQLIMGAFVVVYVVLRKIPLKEFIGWGRAPLWRHLKLAIVLLLGILPLVYVLANYFNRGPSEEQDVVKFFREIGSNRGRILVAFAAVVMAPLAEELVFRGFLYRIFKSYFGKIAAMVFTSVLFAAFHGNIPTLLPLTLLAFALTIGLELSGSLIVSIAMHAIFNATSLIFMLIDTAK